MTASGGTNGGASTSAAACGAPRASTAAAAAAAAPSGGGGLLEDIRDAFPQLPWKLIFKGISFLASIIVFVSFPALRVENGSADSCDPLRTYGEITQKGMQALHSAAGGAAALGEVAGHFVDIGSGHGAFPLWACGSVGGGGGGAGGGGGEGGEGGGFTGCLGVELKRERHEVAEAALRTAAAAPAAAGAPRPPPVRFLLGDVKELAAQVFREVRLAYWNNLCFPSDVSEAVVEHFASTAPLGAELWTLAALPEVPSGIVKVDVEVDLEMSWRTDPYRPFRYVRRLPDADAVGEAKPPPPPQAEL